jgi:8-oxo-dGTP diphosphatase
MNHYVTGFMFSKDMRKVLLINKLQPPWQAGKFNGLGGKIEKNESSQMAMVREFTEECGLKTHTTDWKELLNIICPQEYHVTFFYTRSDNIYLAKSLEAEQLTIFDTYQLPENIIENLSWIIPMCLND